MNYIYIFLILVFFANNAQSQEVANGKNEPSYFTHIPPNGIHNGFYYSRLKNGYMEISEGKIAFVAYRGNSEKEGAIDIQNYSFILEPENWENYKIIPGKSEKLNIRRIKSGNNYNLKSYSSIKLENKAQGKSIEVFWKNGQITYKIIGQIDLKVSGGNLQQAQEGVEIKQGHVRLILHGAFRKNNLVSFQSSRTILNYATFIGGSQLDHFQSMEVDNDGNSYLTGWTYSPEFPVTSGAIQGSNSNLATFETIISSFDKNGNLRWSTYYGGDKHDQAYAIGIDGSGKIYVAGRTTSTDLLVSTDAYQSVNNAQASWKAFLLCVNKNGNFLGATYFGGSLADRAYAMAIDKQNNIIIGGITMSQDLPGVQGKFQETFGGMLDSYIAKFSSISNLLWATYLGGDQTEDIHAITIDNDDNIIVGGDTRSQNFPVSPNAFQTQHMGSAEIYVCKFSPAGAMLWSTFIGGNAMDDINTLAVDKSNNIYFGGYSLSNDFPIVVQEPPYKWIKDAGSDMVLGKFSPTGTALWTTFYGGNGDEQILAIKVNSYNHLFAVGRTYSTDFPLYNDTMQEYIGGMGDVAILAFDTMGNISQSSFWGGSKEDYSTSLALYNDSILYISGGSESLNFPTTTGAFQSSQSGEGDAFLAILDVRKWFTIPPSDTIINTKIGLYQNNYVIYPNPFKERLILSIGDFTYKGAFSIEFINLLGEKKFSQTITDEGFKNLEIDGSYLPAGVYFLKIYSGGDSNPMSITKLIKN
jgi:hypothetical protein